MATEVADDMAGSGQPKAAVLLIVGEPFSDSSKQQILDEIGKGLKRWDGEASGVDIDPELTQMALRADLGDERRHGERVVHYASDRMTVELLINAQAQTVKDSLKTLLTSLSPAKAVIYAGYAFHGTAAWVMQDDLFSFAMFSQVFKDTNVENALKQTEGAALMLSTVGGTDWAAALKGSDLHKRLKVSVNPAPKTDSCQGMAQFSAYIGNLVRMTPLTSMLQASDVIGNISFSRPVLYIFPSYQGDAALFGMKGFNMLVDGGYSRRPCFWDFVRHLDGIDALLMTHLGPDNLFGIKALLERKMVDSIHPDIDYMYMNVAKTTPSSNGAKAVTNGESEDSELVINLAAEGSMLVDMSRKLGHTPHPLTRPLSSNLEPVNLFHKIGKGSLDMYILNPVGDAKEMKEFLAQWGKQTSSFSQANGIPIPNCSSICALLVVRPASSMEKVTRILFPGTAPQHKLLEGLERVKHLEFLKHATFCTHDLHKAKKAAAGLTNGRASSTTRRPISATTSRATKAEPPKHLDTKGSSSRAPLTSPASSRTPKGKKDTSNKRVSSVTKDKEKVKRDEKEKENRSKSSTASSPSKASIKTISPVKSPSPARTPATASPEEPPQKAAKPPEDEKPTEPLISSDLNQHVTSVPATDVITAAPTKTETLPADNNRLAASPDALPEPDDFGSDVDFGHQQPPSRLINERQKLQELGIHDNEDDDEGVDNRFDEKENGCMFGTRDFSEEEVQPQALPEPVAVLETPTSSEPDMMPDSFAKPSLMEQSQFFEHGIEPDYGTEGDVSITDSRLEEAVEKETVDTVSASEPVEEGSYLMTEPATESVPEPSSFIDQPQTLDSSVSDYPVEDSLFAAQQKAEESSLITDSLAEQTAEPSLMTQHLSEEQTSYAEKIADVVPETEPPCLMPDAITEDISRPVESHMQEFAPHPSFGSEIVEQQSGEQLPAGLMNSEFSEEPEKTVHSTDFPAEGEPTQFDDEEVKDTSFQADMKEEINAGFSDEEEEAAPAQNTDEDKGKVNETFTPTCLGSLQTTSLEHEPQLYNNVQDFGREIQEDSSTSMRDASPVPQEPDLEDHIKDSHSAVEEPSFEDSLKEASPEVEGSSFHDSLREDSPPLQQQQLTGDLDTAPALVEPGMGERLREASPSMGELGFDRKEEEASSALEETDFSMKEREGSPALEESGSFDVKDREASPVLEEPEFDMKEEEASPAFEKSGFDLKEREDSPALDTGFGMNEREESPAMDIGIGMKEREMSPTMDDTGFDMKKREESPAMDTGIGMKEREVSPAMDTGIDIKEREMSPTMDDTGFDMKEREESPAMDTGIGMKEREVSPAIDDTGFGMNEREVSPAMDTGVGMKEREMSPTTDDTGFDVKEREESPFMMGEREASPALEEPGFEMKERDVSPAMEEQHLGIEGSEASPALEEPEHEEKEREISPAIEEQEFGLEAGEEGPVQGEPDFEMNERKEMVSELKDREESPAMERTSFDDLAKTGFDPLKEKETSPVQIEPEYGMEKDSSPALEEPTFDTKDEVAGPILEAERDDLREPSPLSAVLEAGDSISKPEEADFTADKAEASEISASSVEQTFQQDYTRDQHLDMSEEEEDKDAWDEKEKIMKKEDVTELKKDFREKEEEEDDELDADDRAQADMMTRQTMDDMDVSDDEGQDDDEETAEAVDSGDNDNDDFVYEKEVNLAVHHWKLELILLPVSSALNTRL